MEASEAMVEAVFLERTLQKSIGLAAIWRGILQRTLSPRAWQTDVKSRYHMQLA